MHDHTPTYFGCFRLFSVLSAKEDMFHVSVYFELYSYFYIMTKICILIMSDVFFNLQLESYSLGQLMLGTILRVFENFELGSVTTLCVSSMFLQLNTCSCIIGFASLLVSLLL